MHRMFTTLALALLALTVCLPVFGDEFTAQDIFEGMIYYDNDQLEGSNVHDYHCVVTQTIEVPGSRTLQVMVKDVYFMVPMYQLDLYDDEPAHIFEPDALITTLEIQELERLRDTSIDDVDCFVIRLTPRDAAFQRFPSTYYLEKDDFRKIRTVNFGTSADFDRVRKVLDYTYAEVEDFMLLDTIVALTEDPDGMLLHTVTAVYTDYEFDIGLTEEFFRQYTGDITVNPSYN